MASISLRHIYKVYPNGVKAVSDFNMEIKDKEFIVFVGPSGCGKSTTLRMIAGLEDITAGELFIGDTLVNDVEPKDRDVAMVFQNYALYPHLTVYENMAFGLRLRHVPEDEIHRKVLWAAQILKLTEYLDRKPKAMSGGQRQRVALGRAILRNPKVFLLDEPLSNLDAKLRTEMRTEISKLHQGLQTTFVYVTHDQVEAMTMGTRIVVMKLGRVQQIDTPKNLYNYPDNKFVAGFIGTPQMNFFDGTLLRQNEKVTINFSGVKDKLVTEFNNLLKVRPSYLNGKEEVTIGIRCEDISIDPETVENSDNVLPVRISHFEELGAETLIYGDLDTSKDYLADSPTRVIIKSYKGSDNLKVGDIVKASFNINKMHFFDKKTENTIVPRVPEVNVFDCSIKSHVLSFLNSKITLPNGIGCQDISKAEVLVPCDSLIEGGKDLKAKVISNETIGDSVITYLETEGRTFFLVGNKAKKVGVTLEFGIDLKRITIEANGVTVVNPFPKFDTFLGAFTNLGNEKKTIRSLVTYLKKDEKDNVKKLEAEKLKELAKVSYQEILVSQCAKQHKQALHDLQEEQSFRIGTEDVGKEGKKRIKNETAAKIKAENERYEKEQKAFAEQKEKEAKLSEADKQAIEANKAAISGQYDKKISEIKASFDRKLELIKNGEASMKYLKPEEAEANKESSEKVKSLETDYKAKREEITKSYDAKISEAQNAYKTASGDEKDKARISISSLRTEKANQIKALTSSTHFEEDNVLFAHKKFFAFIDGYGVVTSEELNHKIVRSLGINLFKSQFRYEIPHDAYTPVENGSGIEAEVLDVLSYGDGGYYAKCISNGTILYPHLKDKVEKGTHLCLKADLSGAHIVENKFDIRLF
jgi:multiple sugar transport system ATP-binding protein